MSAEPVSFERDVKPLFRERDRGSMSSHFDLWSYDDVSANSDAILDVLESGSMPCDGPWDPDRVENFRRWVQGGKAAWDADGAAPETNLHMETPRVAALRGVSSLWGSAVGVLPPAAPQGPPEPGTGQQPMHVIK